MNWSDVDKPSRVQNKFFFYLKKKCDRKSHQSTITAFRLLFLLQEGIGYKTWGK